MQSLTSYVNGLRAPGLVWGLSLGLFVGGALAQGAPKESTAPQKRNAAVPKAGFRTFEKLLSAFRRSPGLEAAFVEKKYIALLAAPLTSRGTLYFQPPHHLARYMTQPAVSTTIVGPKMLRAFDGARWTNLPLAAKPMVRLLVDSFLKILQGDQKQLGRVYQITFSTKKAPGKRPASKRFGEIWQVELRPKPGPLGRIIKRITVRGQGLRVHELRVDETSGDYAITTFKKTNPQRRFSPSEAAKIFRPTGQ